MKAPLSRVVLTGATGGIGQAMAAALLRAGASVMLVGRSAASLSAQADRLLQDIPAAKGHVAWHDADITAEAGLAGLRDAASAWGVNVLIHNAGVSNFGRLESVGSDDVAQVLHTNLLAPMLLTQALLPHLLRQTRSQVICVGSTLGSIGLPGFSVYCASKFGLRGFAESLRRELTGTPVRVQYLGPRTTRTKFNSPAVDDYNRATGTASDEPETVAAALVRMLEDESALSLLGFPEKLAARINGCAPALLDSDFVKHRHQLPLPAAAFKPAS
jgi:short-subunit dehydrogenase